MLALVYAVVVRIHTLNHGRPLEQCLAHSKAVCVLVMITSVLTLVDRILGMSQGEDHACPKSSVTGPYKPQESSYDINPPPQADPPSFLYPRREGVR